MIHENITDFAAALSPMAALAGLDLGTKTIGVALSDRMLTVATPTETIKRKKFTADAERLVALLKGREIGGIVLGLPRNMDGSEGPRARASRAYASNLAEAFSLPVLLWDERWSTQSAEAAMIGLDVSRRRRAERIDAEAATVILQAAIDAATGSPLL